MQLSYRREWNQINEKGQDRPKLGGHKMRRNTKVLYRTGCDPMGKGGTCASWTGRNSTGKNWIGQNGTGKDGTIRDGTGLGWIEVRFTRCDTVWDAAE